MRSIYVIGCGGGGSYLAPALYLHNKYQGHPKPLVFMDGDTFDRGNVKRQNGAKPGVNKAEAFAELYPGSIAVPKFLTVETEVETGSTLFLCVDNHPARKAALQIADDRNCTAIIGGNEYQSGEAYLYKPAYKGTQRDPRVRYPNLLTDEAGDPTRPPCNGEEVLASSPQLAIVNNAVAALMLMLYYANSLKDLDDSVLSTEHRFNFNQFRSMSWT